jgi:hypothetical protein
MRPSLKGAALACAAVVLVGATAVGSQGSSGSPAAASGDGPTAITFKAGQRGDTADIVALWRLHVKPGLYSASMRATLFIQPADPNATSAWGICGVIDANTFQSQFTRIYFADSSTTPAGNGAPAAMAGSSVVRVTPDVKPGVICYVGDATMQLYQPITVTFTSLGKRTYGTTTEIPIGKSMGKQLKHIFGTR